MQLTHVELDTGWWTIESNFKVWQLGSKLVCPVWAYCRRCKVRLGGWIRDFVFSPLGARGNLQAGSSRRTQGCTYIHIYILYICIRIHMVYICIYIYIYRLEIDLTQIQQLHSQASEWVVLVNHQAFWSPDLWNYLRAQSRLFNHLAHGVLYHPYASMSLNVLNGKFARSAKAFFDSVHMGAGLNVGELLRVKGRRRSVSLKEHRGFFPSPGRNDICQLFLWRYFILKLVMMKVCMAQGPQYREAYWTLQATLIRSTWRSLSNLGRTGTLRAGRSTASMASPLRDKMWTRSLRRATWVQQNPTMRFGDSGCWYDFFLASLVQGTFGSVSFVFCLV